jgi:hypothetical protein
VLVLLLIPRLLWKAEILLSQVRDKFPPVEKIDCVAVVRGHAVEQFTFKSRLSHYIHSLQVCMYVSVLSLLLEYIFHNKVPFLMEYKIISLPGSYANIKNV